MCPSPKLPAPSYRSCPQALWSNGASRAMSSDERPAQALGHRPRNSLLVGLMPPQSKPRLPQMNVAKLGWVVGQRSQWLRCSPRGQVKYLPGDP